MCESLEERLCEIERLLGIDQLEKNEPLNFDVSGLKKKLQDVKAGFILQTPIEKLWELKRIYNEEALLTTKDKSRTIAFNMGLMEKRAELLQELQKTSDVVLNSDRFSKVEEFMPQLEVAEKGVYAALELVNNFDVELNEFYEELQLTLRDISVQLEEMEEAVFRLEQKKLQQSEA